MARNKSPYDFLNEHIRGIYFPLHYGKPEPVQMSLSRSAFQNRPFEAVVKVVSHIKAGRGPLNAMRYLAQKSAGLEEVRPLYDEEGTLLKPDDFERKLSEMPRPKRKDGRQLAHIVVSFPKAARMTAEKTERFMEKYLEPFAERGFKYVYCSHVHQSAVHGHVLLCETNGRERLRFGKKELMMMRQHQVEVGKAFGLNIRASYCSEREICIDGTKAKPKRKTLLERQVPEWSKRRKTEASRHWPFGITFEAKRYDINEASQKTLDVWAANFAEPERAKQLFIEMFAENSRTAFWYARNNAKVFGETDTPRPPAFPTSKTFKLTAAEIARIRPEKSITIRQGQERSIER